MSWARVRYQSVRSMIGGSAVRNLTRSVLSYRKSSSSGGLVSTTDLWHETQEMWTLDGCQKQGDELTLQYMLAQAHHLWENTKTHDLYSALPRFLKLIQANSMSLFFSIVSLFPIVKTKPTSQSKLKQSRVLFPEKCWPVDSIPCTPTCIIN